jgi:hypothetical protein
MALKGIFIDQTLRLAEMVAFFKKKIPQRHCNKECHRFVLLVWKRRNSTNTVKKITTQVYKMKLTQAFCFIWKFTEFS